MSMLEQIMSFLPALVDYVDRMANPPIEPEDLPPEWDDATGEYDNGAQEIDLRPVRLDGRPVEIVVPHFDPFLPAATDLYGAFASS